MQKGGENAKHSSRPSTRSTRAMVVMAKKTWFALMIGRPGWNHAVSRATRPLPLPRYRAGAVAGSHAAAGHNLAPALVGPSGRRPSSRWADKPGPDRLGGRFKSRDSAAGVRQIGQINHLSPEFRRIGR